MATAGAERTTGCVAPAASGESGRTGVLGAGVLTLPAPSSPAPSPLLEAAPSPSADFASSPSAAGSASPSAGGSPLATGAGGSSPSAGVGGSSPSAGAGGSPSAGAGGSDSSTTSVSSGSSAGAGDSIGRKTSDFADASDSRISPCCGEPSAEDPESFAWRGRKGT